MNCRDSVKKIMPVAIALYLLLVACGHRHENAEAAYSDPKMLQAEQYYITGLRQGHFEDGGIRITKKIEDTPDFTRYTIEYDSQGLRITGMMNIPRGKGPFPVVILNHGHYDQKKYSIGLGFKQAADLFARRRYLAIGSDFRNHGGSSRGDDFFRHIGSLYDVVNLLVSVKALPYADKERIGMWGYSGGGWLTLKAAVIRQDIKVIALYGSMSSDDRDNYYALIKWHVQGLDEVNRIIGSPDTAPGNYERMSSINYLEYLFAKVIIHHGEEDRAVPIEWSKKLKDRLIEHGKTVEYYTYPKQGHVLAGEAWMKSMERSLDFFDRYLKSS